MSSERPWLKNYPSGVPANIDPDKYDSLIQYIREVCEKYKDRNAFSYMGKELTFQKFDALSDQFGAYLQSRGLEPGDRIALMMPNVLQYPIAIFGAMKAGLIVVNTNPLYTPREMDHQFNDSGVKAVIILENFCANLQKILDKTSIKFVITVSLGGMLGGVKGPLMNFAVKHIKKMVPKYNIPNTVKFVDALKQGKAFTLKSDFENNPDSVVAHQYTGGTTGVSKGAMLTNRNIIANLMQVKELLNPFLHGVDQHVILCPLPMYHIFAFTVNCLLCLDLGATTVLVVNPRDLKSVVKEFDRYEITGMTGVNTLYNALLNFEAFRNTNHQHLKFCSAGGTALQKGVAGEWEKLVGLKITEGFGMTECSPVVTMNPKTDIRIGSVGVPVPSTDVRIVSENEETLGYNEVGEIRVKGPQVMKGYYNRPEETAKTFDSEGWLKTGDMGIMGEDGFVSIVDRKKDMILVSGFNVYPNEIEDVLCMHDKISEAAAIGMPSEKSGECVKVFIIKKDNSLTKDEVLKHCKENLTGYKVPKQIEFREELPKSTVGKILRRKLKEEA